MLRKTLKTISKLCGSLAMVFCYAAPLSAECTLETFHDEHPYEHPYEHPCFAPPLYPCQGGACLSGKCHKRGIWLPEGPPLFRPFIADPRQVCFSASWRFNDQALTKNVIPVSYGDIFPIYRWFDVKIGPVCGMMEIGIEGALWAVFDPCAYSAPLINADYYVAFPLTYSFGAWSFRLRGYHISSHLGDEWILNHPGIDRRNPSAEYIDLFASYMMTQEIRLYGGLGYILEADESFPRKKIYAEAGTEIRMLSLGFNSFCNNLSGRPFYAMHWRYSGDFKHHVDMTYALGYEFAKTRCLCRRMRLYLEYHYGYSLEGQFCKHPTDYLSLRLTYGF
jgi:hypothetical protein